MMPNTSAIIIPMTNTPVLNRSPIHAPILISDLAKLIEKCQLVFDSLGCITFFVCRFAIGHHTILLQDHTHGNKFELHEHLLQ